MLENKDVLVARMADDLPILRKKLRLSQEGLAEIIGVSRFTVTLYETQKRTIPWNVFLALVFVFDKNKETSALLKALGIYTKELDDFLLIDPRNSLSK